MAHNDRQEDVHLQVLTSAGNFPDEGFRGFRASDKLSLVLDEAKSKLELQNTSSWAVRIGNQQYDPELSIAANGIPDRSRLTWGPVEPGGGLSAPRTE